MTKVVGSTVIIAGDQSVEVSAQNSKLSLKGKQISFDSRTVSIGNPTSNGDMIQLNGMFGV